MHAYLNYPNPHITIHRDVSCAQIHMHEKVGQRHIQVRPSTLKAVLIDFINEKIDFGAEQRINDLWLDIALDTNEQEAGLIHVIQGILGQRYAPFVHAPVITHC